MTDDQTPSPTFRGFRRPTYTPVPDELFDELLPDLSGAELKVLLYVVRRTFGFKRERDAISLSQMLGGLRARDGRVLDRGVGLSKPTLLQALRTLAAKSVIQAERRRSAERGDEPTVYRVHLAEPEGAKEAASDRRPDPLVKNLDHPGVKPLATPVGNKSAPQETGGRQTERNASNRATDRLHGDGTGTPQGSLGERPGADRGRPPVSVAEAIAGWRRRGGMATPRRTQVLGDTAGGGPGPGAAHSGGRADPAEAREVLERYMVDFARELDDRAPLRSSTTRLYNLFVRSGLGLDAFVARIYAARSLVRERTAGTRSAPMNGRRSEPVRHTIRYWFATVEDLLGFGARAPDGAPVGEGDRPA